MIRGGVFFLKICGMKPFWNQLELAESYKHNQFLSGYMAKTDRQRHPSEGSRLLEDAYEIPTKYCVYSAKSAPTKLNLLSSMFLSQPPRRKLP